MSYYVFLIRHYVLIVRLQLVLVFKFPINQSRIRNQEYWPFLTEAYKETGISSVVFGPLKLHCRCCLVVCFYTKGKQFSFILTLRNLNSIQDIEDSLVKITYILIFLSKVWNFLVDLNSYSLRDSDLLVFKSALPKSSLQIIAYEEILGHKYSIFQEALADEIDNTSGGFLNHP